MLGAAGGLLAHITGRGSFKVLPVHFRSTASTGSLPPERLEQQPGTTRCVLVISADLRILHGGCGQDASQLFGGCGDGDLFVGLFMVEDRGRVASDLSKAFLEGRPVEIAGARPASSKIPHDITLIPAAKSSHSEQVCTVLIARSRSSSQSKPKLEVPKAPMHSILPGEMDQPILDGNVNRASEEIRSSEQLLSNPSIFLSPVESIQRQTYDQRDSADSLRYSSSYLAPPRPARSIPSVSVHVQTDMVWTAEGFECRKCIRPPLQPGTTEAVEAARAVAIAARGLRRQRLKHGVPGPLDGVWTLISEQQHEASLWLLRLTFSGDRCLDNIGVQRRVAFTKRSAILQGGSLTLEGLNLLHRDGRSGKRFTWTRGDGGLPLGAPLSHSSCSSFQVPRYHRPKNEAGCGNGNPHNSNDIVLQSDEESDGGHLDSSSDAEEEEDLSLAMCVESERERS